LFHAFLACPVVLLGATMLVLNLFLMVVYRKYYISLFTVSPGN